MRIGYIVKRNTKCFLGWNPKLTYNTFPQKNITSSIAVRRLYNCLKLAFLELLIDISEKYQYLSLTGFQVGDCPKGSGLKPNRQLQISVLSTLKSAFEIVSVDNKVKLSTCMHQFEARTIAILYI